MEKVMLDIVQVNCDRNNIVNIYLTNRYAILNRVSIIN